MNHNKTRLMTISGATLALVIASTASVAAFGPRDDDDRGHRAGKGRIGAEFKGRMERGMADRGAMRAKMGAGIRGAFDDFERRETTVQTADGTTTHRVEQGHVEDTADGSLAFTLGSGESVSVSVDDDTEIVAFSEQTVERGRWSRERLVPSEVELGEVEVGTEIVVWSDSEDGADFAAERIVVKPAVDEDVDADDATEADADATEDATATEDASATDA